MTSRSNDLTRRQFLAGALGAAGLLAMAGCSNAPAADDADASAGTDASAEADAAGEGAGTDAASGRVLVAYFSAQGHTRRVAEDAAAALGADLFEIVPAEPYTDEDLNYRNETSRVCLEHDDESLRDIELAQTTPDNWDDYDTVLVGYPIWWAIAGWPTNGFASGNDFTGKTVIPFCTSASSSLGQSGELLAELAGTGNWQEGQRFGSNAGTDEVQAWAAGLA